VRPGVRLGVDVGSVRVGVARSDPAGLIATPIVTLRKGQGDLDSLAELAAEHEAVEVVVGLPRTLADREGAAADAATAYARLLVQRLPGLSVRLVDERLSTVSAQRGLQASGVGTREGRKVIDQVAAVIILQGALDTERTTGEPPGHLLSARAGDDVGAGGAGTDMKVEE
jgi:putative Holliday junction resolvase